MHSQWVPNLCSVVQIVVRGDKEKIWEDKLVQHLLLPANASSLHCLFYLAINLLPKYYTINATQAEWCQWGMTPGSLFRRLSNKWCCHFWGESIKFSYTVWRNTYVHTLFF